jgi:hypothetical protein
VSQGRDSRDRGGMVGGRGGVVGHGVSFDRSDVACAMRDPIGMGEEVISARGHLPRLRGDHDKATWGFWESVDSRQRLAALAAISSLTPDIGGDTPGSSSGSHYGCVGQSKRVCHEEWAVSCHDPTRGWISRGRGGSPPDEGPSGCAHV